MLLQAKICDSYHIAKLHHSTISSGFLSKLGITFLSTMYKYMIKKEIVLVDMEGYRVRGFVSCSLNSDHVLKRFLFYPEGVFISLFALLSKPSLIFSSIETIMIPFKRKSLEAYKDDADLPKTELLSISVAPDFQKYGIGTHLLTELERILRERGVKKYKVIAGSNLTGANRFYQKNGFELAGTLKIHRGELSNLYCKVL